MSFFGASPSLCRSREDRVFNSADTPRRGTLVQYRLALETEWDQTQVR